MQEENAAKKIIINNGSKAKKITLIMFLSLAIFGILAAFGFWGYETVYAEKIYPGVKISQVDAGGQNPEETKILVNSITSELKSERISINTGDKKYNPTLGEIGVEFDNNQIIGEAYKIGRNKTIWQRFTEELKTVMFSREVLISPSINSEKFNEYFQKNTDLISDPRDASLRVEHDELVTVLSENGSKVDEIDFQKKLSANINANQINLPITIKTISIKPKISETEISLIKPDVMRMVSLPLEFTYNYRTYMADQETIMSWLSILPGKKGNLIINILDDKIKEFIDTFSIKINLKPIDKKINAATGDVIEQGRDGVEINYSKTIEDVKNVLNNNEATEENHQIAIETTKIDRAEKQIQPEDIPKEGGTPGLYEGRYIEVNLSEQKMYAFDGYNLDGVYIVSTGKWSTPTPIGTRYIDSKSDKAYSAQYDLYMPYWNSIGGGYGIHELPEWANGYKEGQSHLGTPVSHGCIRLGVGPAEFIYNWAPIGTPVYIHK